MSAATPAYHQELLTNSEVERRHKERDFTGLIELAEKGDPGQRVAAVGRLGALRRGHVAGAVGRVLLHDEHEPAQVAAARVLASLNGDVARRALLDAEPGTSRARLAVAEALGILSDRRAEPKLTAMLADADAPVRAAAAQALGLIGSVRSVAGLREALADRNRRVRSRARRALIALGTPASVAALGTNPNRWRPWRLLDVRAARRSLKRHERWKSGDIARPLDRFTVLLWAGALKALVVALGIVLVDVLVLGASLPVVATLALAVAVGLGAILYLGGDPLRDIDIALARAKRCPEGASLASPTVTVARVVVRRPIVTSALCALPLATDLLIGALGVAPGLVVGFLLVIAGLRSWQALIAGGFPDERAQHLLVDSDTESLRAARFFT